MRHALRRSFFSAILLFLGFSYACSPVSTISEDGLCSVDQMMCSDACVDLMQDVDHCGSCDNACESDELCFSGICENPCTNGSITTCTDD
ncbi:hypothetical protein KAI87_14005, partial [Myxococcota bacterium]|nr:hypothetical protein [Myxococcota bacterium]